MDRILRLGGPGGLGAQVKILFPTAKTKAISIKNETRRGFFNLSITWWPALCVFIARHLADSEDGAHKASLFPCVF